MIQMGSQKNLASDARRELEGAKKAKGASNVTGGANYTEEKEKKLLLG